MAGMLIINADDFGRDRQTTDCIFECVKHGTVSSTSAMVFMEDSVRAANLANEYGIDCGLHLNFTTPFSMARPSASLVAHQEKVSRFLRHSRFSQVLFHPGLVGSFRYVVAAQVDEFRRLYEREPVRMDGHHHMHLCANVLFGKLMPVGAVVRRSFSFSPGEKSQINLRYRNWVDNQLKRRYQVVDFLFAMPSAERLDRFQMITSIAQRAVVEMETHPINPNEYSFLTSGEAFSKKIGLNVAPSFAAAMRNLNDQYS
jgi:predicted glycoside hydrolase/deacetylase ChbG (UPF0249 family)